MVAIRNGDIAIAEFLVDELGASVMICNAVSLMVLEMYLIVLRLSLFLFSPTSSFTVRRKCFYASRIISSFD
jgi:hypothetical protein